MWEYVLSNGIASAVGFGFGWLACSRYKALEDRVDRIDKELHDDN